MRVFLDTNVLASAVATRGLCTDVLREVLSSHELVISDVLLNELKQVLQSKFNVPPAFILEFITLLQQDTILANSVNLPDVKLKGKNDKLILAGALSGKAELLVTGDKELLALGRFKELEIVSPRTFWEKLKS